MATTALERRWKVFQFHPPVLPAPPLRAELGAAAQGSTYNNNNNNNNNLSDDGGGQQWRSFDSSVNAVSFGFVATAILISMFLVMAIFERFIRPNSPPSSTPQHHHSSAGGRSGGAGNVVEAGGHHLAMGAFYANKFGFPSPKMTVYSKGVSVLMPGEQVPTFIAHPAPVPCPPDRVHFPSNIQLVVTLNSEPNPTHGQSSTGPPLGHGGS